MKFEQKQEILNQVALWLDKASVLYSLELHPPLIKFDLSGAAAGQYQRQHPPLIRFNPQIAKNHFHLFCTQTVPHEVAHLVTDQRYGNQRIKPHGAEWRQVMIDFGLEPKRCHDYDLSGVKIRRQTRYAYRCDCQQHVLSTTRHNRARYKGVVYRCRHCGAQLKACKPAPA